MLQTITESFITKNKNPVMLPCVNHIALVEICAVYGLVVLKAKPISFLSLITTIRNCQIKTGL